MKLITTFFICFLMYTFIHCGSNIEVPDKVSKVFRLKYPGAIKVSWEPESEKEWEAHFTLKKADFSAVFREDGTWLETEQEISNNAIPSQILETIKNNFEVYKIKEAEVVETVNGRLYELEIEVEKEALEILFNGQGREIEREKEDDD